MHHIIFVLAQMLQQSHCLDHKGKQNPESELKNGVNYLPSDKLFSFCQFFFKFCEE
jgi:hypothetical protein